MSYHGLPYLVTKSTMTSRSNNPYPSEQHNIPEHVVSIHYPASLHNARNLSSYRPCDTVCPPHAHNTRAQAKPAISDVQPLRVLAALLILVLIALGCTFVGFEITHVFFNTTNSISTSNETSTTNSTTTPSSTPSSSWKQGAVPQLYEADPQWSSPSYDSSTIGNAGSAAFCLAMVRISLTGDTATGPIEIASLAHQQGYTSSGDATTLLTDGPKEFGLIAQSVEANELAIRRQINAGFPVICDVKSEAFGNHHTYVVLTSIDERGQLIIHDPTSPKRSAMRWSFSDIISASTALWSYRLIG